MAKIVIDEIITLIGFKTTKESKQAIRNVENGIRSMRKMALVASGAMTALAFSMSKVVGGIDQQAKFAAGIGLSFENLQKLQFAGQKAGASVSEMNSFLETLTKTMTSTIPGQYNAALLQLGISARDVNGNIKELVPTITEIAAKLSKMTPVRRQQFAARLGASSRIANFLGQDPKEILKALKEAEDIGGVLPGSQAKVAAALIDDSLLRVKTTLKVLSQTLFLSLSPAVSKLLDQFDVWLVKNKKIVNSNLGEFIKAVSQGFSNFGAVILSVTNITDALTKKVFSLKTNLGEMNLVTLLTEGALIALAASVVSAAAPFVALGAAIIGIMAVMPDWLKISKSAATLYNALFPSSVDKTTESINAASSALENFLSLLSKLNVTKGITDIFDSVAEDINITSPGGGTGALANIVKQQEQSENSGMQTSILGNLLAGNDSSSSLRVPLRSSSENKNTTNNVSITVNGSGSPIAVGKEVKKQFDLNTAVQTASPGFNRPKAG